MKKILLVMLTILLVGCSKRNAEKLVNIEGYTIYVSTPSGAIYIASGSQLFKYTDEKGKQKNINDYKGE